MTPTLGRIVLLALSATDAEQINRRRTTGADISDRIKLNGWHIGAQAHIGNVAKEGTIVPAMVVAKWSGGSSVNLQAFLDGNDVFWATSREEGTKPGQWAWPVIEKPAAPAAKPADKPAAAPKKEDEAPAK